MAFQDDADADRGNVFFPDAAGKTGFSQAVTHTDLLTGTVTALNSVPEEQVFSIRDPLNQVKFHVSAAELASVGVGDRLTFDGLDYTILNVRTLQGVHEVSCEREDERQ